MDNCGAKAGIGAVRWEPLAEARHDPQNTWGRSTLYRLPFAMRRSDADAQISHSVCFLLDAILLSFDVWAAEIDVYAVAEDDLFEPRLSGLMVLKSAIYNDEVGEATLREDGSFERR